MGDATPQELLDAAIYCAAGVDQLIAALDENDQDRATVIKDRQKQLADLLKQFPAGQGFDDSRAVLQRAKGKLTQRARVR